MTFQELESKIGKQVESEWHQAKGGGWIQNSAKVDNEELIRDNSIVFGNAQVSGHAWVSGHAQVSGGAWVSGGARVFGDAQLSGVAWVSGNAWVSGGAWVKPVLFLIDSRGYGCTNCKHGYIQIGCHCHTFAEWSGEIGKQLAVKQNFSAEEIKEYSAIVELFSKIGK